MYENIELQLPYLNCVAKFIDYTDTTRTLELINKATGEKRYVVLSYVASKILVATHVLRKMLNNEEVTEDEYAITSDIQTYFPGIK